MSGSKRDIWGFFKGLRFRLTCLTNGVIVPLVLVLVVLLDHAAVERLRGAADDSLQRRARELAGITWKWDQDAALMAQNLARQPGIVSMNPSQQSAVLAAVATTYKGFDSLRTTTIDGKVLARDDEGPNCNYVDRAWFRGALDGKPLTREAVISRTTGRPVVAYASPIRDEQGQIVGTISIGNSLPVLAARVGKPALGSTGYRVLLDETGRVLLHPDPKMIEQHQDMSDFAPVRQALANDSSGSSISYVDSDGNCWLWQASRLENGWLALSLQQESEVLADIQQFRKYELYVVLAAGLVASTLMWLTASKLTRPITNLLAVVSDVAKGQLNRRADEKHAPGEIGQLACSFNHMVEQIEAKVERKMQALTLRNAELQRMHQIAQRQAETKEEFLANMSHEIRTPLTAILGYAELLTDINMSEAERTKALQSIQYDSQHLLGVINDVLDIAKLDANKMETECSEFPVAALINDVLSLMRPKAQEKGLEIAVEFASELPELVWTDPARLRQILLNLVGNAVKYTQRGSIRLIVRIIEPRDSSDGFLQFDVIDTGMGMSEEHIANIFQPFSQGHAGVSREYGGTGLGLVISQRFARLLGGDISAVSKFGEGSTFTLTIGIGPIHGRRKMNPNMMMHDSIAAIPFMEDLLANQLDGLQVLLADDVETSRELIARMLSSAGAQVAVTDTGKRAVHHAIEAFQNGQSYNVILMDVQMPELDGISATKKLRQLGYPGPIIILTASITAANRDRCIKAGANDFARKPIERDKLLSLVAKWGRQQKDVEAQRIVPAA